MNPAKGATELNQQNKWIRMNYNMKGGLKEAENDSGMLHCSPAPASLIRLSLALRVKRRLSGAEKEKVQFDHCRE